jgi:hypothetical protein
VTGRQPSCPRRGRSPVRGVDQMRERSSPEITGNARRARPACSIHLPSRRSSAPLPARSAASYAARMRCLSPAVYRRRCARAGTSGSGSSATRPVWGLRGRRHGRSLRGALFLSPPSGTVIRSRSVTHPRLTERGAGADIRILRTPHDVTGFSAPTASRGVRRRSDQGPQHRGLSAGWRVDQGDRKVGASSDSAGALILDQIRGMTRASAGSASRRRRR